MSPEGLTNNFATLATSSGIIKRPFPFSSEKILSPSLTPISSVAVEPGAIEFTIILLGSNICANPCVKPFNDHLEIP